MEDNRVFKDEESHKDEEQIEKTTNVENPIGFKIGYFIMLLPYIAIFFYYKLYQFVEIFSAIELSVLFAVIGFVLWAIFKVGFNKRMWGKGFLWGGLTPFLLGLLVLFILTGGCGLLIRG